ncbi:MAG: crotonase/enoyl-CoA hydratase family protein [Sphingomonadales bacterium]|nr:crotonase/enoyl-CoA hydratase family protein [Sphingomonadales bacterium]
MTERVTISVENGVADVRLARADKLNALDQEQFEAIGAMIDRIGAMKDVRCVVLSGEGRGFCAGIDLDSLSSNPALHDLTPRTHGDANAFQQIAWGWRTLPVPVIAAVHGFAFGGGFQLMLGADIRIATPDAQLSMMEVRWGLAPDVAGIALLRGLVRDDVARELTYTARKMSGDEAHSLGIVTHVDSDPLSRAMTLARAIAANSPDAVRASKRLFNFAIDAGSADILLAESKEQQILLASANHAETIAAAREKRLPVFKD